MDPVLAFARARALHAWLKDLQDEITLDDLADELGWPPAVVEEAVALLAGQDRVQIYALPGWVLVCALDDEPETAAA